MAGVSIEAHIRVETIDLRRPQHVWRPLKFLLFSKLFVSLVFDELNNFSFYHHQRNRSLILHKHDSERLTQKPQDHFAVTKTYCSTKLNKYSLSLTHKHTHTHKVRIDNNRPRVGSELTSTSYDPAEIRC